MAARRNFSSSVVINIFQHEQRNFVSPNGHVMFCLLYKYQLHKYHSEIASTLCYHNNDYLFTCEDNNHIIFTCEDMKFLRERFAGISLVFT